MTQCRILKRGVDVLAATPGRLLDFCQHKIVALSKVTFLVLDEADELLNMGFAPQVRHCAVRVGVGRAPPKWRRGAGLK